MDSLGANPQLTAEFVKFLNMQLQECKDQLQRSHQENASLRQQLESAAYPSSDGFFTSHTQDTEMISDLTAEIATLKKELAVAQCAAESNRSDAATWRERYEKAQGSSFSTVDLGDLQRRAAVEKVMRMMKEDLALCVPVQEEAPSTTQKFADFNTFMSRLSNSAIPLAHAAGSRVVFDVPKLQILPKAAMAACDGGFAFFGALLQWCASPSQNALLICPTRHYTPHPAAEPGDSSWSKATRWSALVGQRREVFDTDGGRLVYAGTFLVHAGPKVLKLGDMPQPLDENVIHELARRTFDPASKAQKTKAKAYLHALGELYKEGATAVQVLGLQRVGFNEAFFAVLRKAYGKRSKASAARARSETQRSVTPQGWPLEEAWGEEGTRKRGREDEPEAGPSARKVRRSVEEESDGWMLDF